MEECEHENALQLTHGFLQHMFGGTTHIFRSLEDQKF